MFLKFSIIRGGNCEDFESFGLETKGGCTDCKLGVTYDQRRWESMSKSSRVFALGMDISNVLNLEWLSNLGHTV